MLRAVLWDLDGTILDTTELILSSYRHAFAKILRREISDDSALANFGEPLANVMSKYSIERAEELMQCYREHNHKHHDKQIRPFAGIHDALANLARRGYRQAVVTSKTEWLSLQGLKLFGLDGFFEEVVGFESTSEHKPSSAPALEALKRLGFAPEQSVFVGDSLADCLCAKSAKIPFLFAEWGPNPCALGDERADFYLKDPRDILHVLPEKGAIF
ncbi:MAG TPA: HAD family hydrolase [candidate division Zixibacteria bacterium]|nr:HAD family hydrolase [candidate division Zixibacteria bacterium]